VHVEADVPVPRLRRVLRDLVALSAIPAVWVGRDPPAVAAGLADTLVALLQLDFAFVHLSDPGGAEAVEAMRGLAWSGFPEWLEVHFATNAPFPRKEIAVDTGDDLGPRRAVAIPIGANGEGGVVVAASEHGDFPTETDRLLLSLAGNHAAAAFQGARLIQERKRVEDEVCKARDELELKVTERTAELRVANDELSALRHVATLVARGVRPAEIFAAVSEEVGRLFGSDLAVVTRFDPDGPVIVGLSRAIEGISIGSRPRLEDLRETAAFARVFRTGRSARLDEPDWSTAGGPIGTAGHRLGIVSSVGSPIFVEGRLWGAISLASTEERLPLDAEGRLENFTELVATALSNAENKAELASSRRRIVTTSDEARRRIERDLHDGVQQRLVSLEFAVRAAQARVPLDDDLRQELSSLANGLADAVQELQELSRGIHPAILSQGGLGPTLDTLARRSTIPVDLTVTDSRLPEPIEVAAYYVVSEALTNATKHAQASRIEVSLEVRGGYLQLSIRDDGIGGADPARGSGLVGLTDRVEALGGSIRVESRPGEGTHITAELPVDPEAVDES
jgi:signal transduction histidine kinase